MGAWGNGGWTRWTLEHFGRRASSSTRFRLHKDVVGDLTEILVVYAIRALFFTSTHKAKHVEAHFCHRGCRQRGGWSSGSHGSSV